MHQLQKTLLARLSAQNGLRYSALTRDFDFEDNILFHLNSLLKKRLINKSEGLYTITVAGLREVKKYEPEQLDDRGAKQFFIGYLCLAPQHHYLLKAHPQGKTNFYNLPSYKPHFGQPLETALPFGFARLTGLNLPSNRFTFTSLHMKTILANDQILFDDAFTIFTVQLTNDEKSYTSLSTDINWYLETEIRNLPHRWPEIDLCIFDQYSPTFLAYTHQSDYILI